MVLFLHNKYKSRIIGKPTYDVKGRWLSVDVRTPKGRTTIIAAYLPPNPQDNSAAKEAWANLQDYVISRHIKKRTVYLGGDLNASLNLPGHRMTPGTSHRGQHRLLTLLSDHAGLTDTFSHCNPSSEYKTFSNSTTWTSPDHILISSHMNSDAICSQTSTITSQLHGFDHSLLTTYINIDEPVEIPKIDRTRIIFDPERLQEYKEALDAATIDIPTDLSPVARAKQFFDLCIKVATDLFTTTRSSPTPSKKSKQVLQMWNDLQAINTAIYNIKHDTPIPLRIRTRTIFTGCDMTLPGLINLRTSTKTQLNSKGRRRATLTRKLFTQRRSLWFTQKRMGKFLSSALSTNTTWFGGVQYTIDPDTGAVSSDPDKTKDLATKRISTTFFTKRIPVPSFIQDTSLAAWTKMPTRFRTIFSNIKTQQVDPDLKHTMDAVTPSELRAALQRMGKNKSPGPSGLTAEMLRHASTEAQETFILPYVNDCIKQRNTPQYTKNLNVWCLEKVQGAGSTMHPTNKLDVRPLSLFEVSYKLVEIILAKRISDVMEPKLHPAQHAFNSLRSVVDAVIAYTFIMEDAKQFKKEIHISNNDCTQAYDAVPPWAMYAVYRYHKFPPALIEMLINMDSNRVGRVLTAHGPGAEFKIDCGLGQGSVLAPLKWNLFLDPMIKAMESTRDPYIMSDRKTSVPIRIIAFADDTTIVASTHKGYLERMALAGEYFGTFGVNFSPSKTNYTYAYTGGRHFKSAPITVRHPNGSTTVQPSSITSPHTPLRYLGAWLSPTLNWKPAKRKLLDEVDRILTILRHKSLTPAEYKYTIQSVLHAKLRYYLAVVPLTDKELDGIDARIAQILKTRMHMATSVSSPLLFLPESEFGASLPSIRDTRAQANISAAHAIVNNPHSVLGKLMRIRLSSLRDHLGWATNPLSNPDLLPPRLWENHWCARIGRMLHTHGAALPDTTGYHTLPGARFQ